MREVRWLYETEEEEGTSGEGTKKMERETERKNHS